MPVTPTLLLMLAIPALLLVLVVPVFLTARALSHSVQSMDRYHEEFHKLHDKHQAIVTSYGALFPPAIASTVAMAIAVAVGVRADTWIHEVGPTQFEINLLHGDPVEVADQAFLFKYAAKEIAIKHGLNAVFMAKKGL